jgi:hypothetical protein
MTAELIANEITADFDDRELNKAVAAYPIQLHMAERDLEAAEALAVSLAPIIGSNAEDRKRNAALYLAGTLVDPARVGHDRVLTLDERQSDSLSAYWSARRLVDQISHDLSYLKAEQQSRRHERTEASTAALESYTGVAAVVVGMTPQKAAA